MEALGLEIHYHLSVILRCEYDGLYVFILKETGLWLPGRTPLAFYTRTSQNVRIFHHIILWSMFIQENITLTIHKLSKTPKQNAVHADCASYSI